MVDSGEHRYDAFLSYARADDPGFRRALLEGLAHAGYRIWFDREAMPNRGTTFGQEIRRAIEASDRLVLLAAPGALTSEYVEQEWQYADDIGKPVVPVVRAVSFGDLPDRLGHYHAVDAARQPVDAAVAELARLLGEPVRPLAQCFHLPGRPAHARDRAELTTRLSDTLLTDRMGPQAAGRAPRVVALYGIPGSGKSTAAAAFAAATRTRRVFSDGIVWLAAGPDFHPLTAARELLRLVAPGSLLPESEAELDVRLSAVLGNRELLIVLDDVRRPEAALPFAHALGAGARMLLTSLDQAVATALGAERIPVGRFDDDAARGLLADWAGGVPLPREADVVLEACDGLPFALAVIGAMIANRTPWEDVAEALGSRRLDELAAVSPGYPHRTVLAVLTASFEGLAIDDPRAAECYLELAGFQPGAVLSRSVLVRLWSRPGRLTPLAARLVLPALERRLLLRPEPESDGFRLHALHEDFVRMRHPDPAVPARELVTSYRRDKGAASWSELPDDGYVFDHLVAHVTALDDRTTLFEMVTREWIQEQWRRHGDLGQALADARRAIALTVRPPADLVNTARLSVLVGQIAATLRQVSPWLIGALAKAGDVDRAVRWAGDLPDAPERFAALMEVAGIVLDSGELTLARRLCRVAAETIGDLGGRVESGALPGLTGLNAVHALVHFPHPDQWEGTEDSLVAVARIPLDALVWLAPLAWRAGTLADLVTVTNPAWELYGHLLPLMAVEELAQQEQTAVARALLDVYPEPPLGKWRKKHKDDFVNAARYRYAVALAAIGDIDAARSMAETLPPDYQSVGRRGLARHLARAGRIDEAVELLGSIGDPTVAADTLADIFDAVLTRGVADECRLVAGLAEACGMPGAVGMLSAAAGDPKPRWRAKDADDPRTALRMGVGIAQTYWERGVRAAAVRMVRKLVPVAKKALGPQWWAPDTVVGVSPVDARAATMLASLLVRTGEPLPKNLWGVTTGVEQSWGGIPLFKIAWIKELAASGRFDEAVEVAELPSAYGGGVLGLAEVLAATKPSHADPDLTGRIRRKAQELAGELSARAVDGALDEALSRVLRTHGLDGPVAPLAAALETRTDVPLSLGVRAGHLADAGRSEDVRRLARLALEAPALAVPDPQARAMVLAAVASGRPGPSPELTALPGLLTEVRTAAEVLGALAETIDLYGRHASVDAAARLARTVPAGPEAELADTLPSSNLLTYPMEISDLDIAAAATARAAAASAMTLVLARAGEETEAGVWLRTAEQFLEGVAWLSPASRGAEAAAPYLWAARCVLDPTAGPEESRTAADVAWYLWDRGHHGAAERCARMFRDRLRGPLDVLLSGGPSIGYAEDFLRDAQLHRAVRTSLTALMAVAAAERGDARLAGELAAEVELRPVKGLPSLSLAEGAGFQAAVALGLHAGGRSGDARDLLDHALSDTLTLARRGELAPFDRLCRAMVLLFPADDAHAIWAYWLQAAAQSGTYAALGMIASYLRWLPARTLEDIVVNPDTGDLERPPGGAVS
ncbi:TIR domain-containing protein [Streptomyces aquilus]|uniref:TIR domain-containing protein n=1 Tax=Streptomyces aquilus TaxID=2548456 RepID=UPI00369A071B